MKKFTEIVANIKSELQELENINKSLSKENEVLKQRLNMSERKDYQELSLEKVFDRLNLTNSKSQKVKAFNWLKRMGVNYVSDFPKMDVTKLVGTREIGTIAIIIVIMELYGIPFNFDEIDDNKLIGQLKDKVAKIKDEIEFI